MNEYKMQLIIFFLITHTWGGRALNWEDCCKPSPQEMDPNLGGMGPCLHLREILKGSIPYPRRSWEIIYFAHSQQIVKIFAIVWSSYLFGKYRNPLWKAKYSWIQVTYKDVFDTDWLSTESKLNYNPACEVDLCLAVSYC